MVTLDIDIKCRDEDHDGLECDGGRGASVDGCYGFCHLYYSFIFVIVIQLSGSSKLKIIHLVHFVNSK